MSPSSFSSDLLSQLSIAIAARAEAARNAVVAVRLGEGRHLTGLVWQPDIVVVSEQSLPRGVRARGWARSISFRANGIRAAAA
jgi:hypothetical protein